MYVTSFGSSPTGVSAEERFGRDRASRWISSVQVVLRVFIACDSSFNRCASDRRDANSSSMALDAPFWRADAARFAIVFSNCLMRDRGALRS